MAIHRKTFFRIIFLVAVLFCSGMNAYSISTMQPCNIELSSVPAGADLGFSPDNDSVGEDEINPSPDFYLNGISTSQRIIIGKSTLVDDFCFSLWQPPKIS